MLARRLPTILPPTAVGRGAGGHAAGIVPCHFVRARCSSLARRASCIAFGIGLPRQPQRSIRRDGPSPVDNLVDSAGRYLNIPGEPVLADLQRLEELFQQDLPRIALS